MVNERDRLIRVIESDGVRVKIDNECHISLEITRAEQDEASQEIEALIAARNAARKAKDFKEADRIRDGLAAMGIQLKDSKDPATGEIKTTWEMKR
jgi:cysteinyl-tRNA synthetase